MEILGIKNRKMSKAEELLRNAPQIKRSETGAGSDGNRIKEIDSPDVFIPKSDQYTPCLFFILQRYIPEIDRELIRKFIITYKIKQNKIPICKLNSVVDFIYENTRTRIVLYHFDKIHKRT